LEKGKTVALVGESGCGKSMTALSILGILPDPPALKPEGEILYKGKNLIYLSEKEMQKIRGSRIAMIFQNPMSSLNPVYTIGNQLLEVVENHLGLERELAKEKIFKALSDVHLRDPKKIVNEYPHQLSGGMLQRVMIAMSLLCDPDILIADEPTTALDVTIQLQILELLKELQSKTGMALLLITHDMGVVAEIAHEVIVMYACQRVEHAKAQEIFYYPAHPYTRGLFQSRPERSIKEGKLPTIPGSVPSITQLPSACRFHPRCRYALKICKEKEPPEFKLHKHQQTAKCWLFDSDLEKMYDEFVGS
jgi:oligopeptide/dipeptide ABC transporter ATP-binding protein